MVLGYHSDADNPNGGMAEDRMNEHEALMLVQEALAIWRDSVEPVLVYEGNALTLEEVKYVIVDPAVERGGQDG